jgi:hypothetical protein
MANPNKVVGQARINVDGDTLETDGESTLELGGALREAQRGDYQAGAFSEKTAESKLTCKILVKRGTSLTALRDIDNATITFQADIGQTFIIRNAYVAEVISLSTSDGKADVVFQGPPAEEL